MADFRDGGQRDRIAAVDQVVRAGGPLGGCVGGAGSQKAKASMARVMCGCHEVAGHPRCPYSGVQRGGDHLPGQAGFGLESHLVGYPRRVCPASAHQERSGK